MRQSTPRLESSEERCPGSGQPIALGAKRATGRRYGGCPVCGRTVPITVSPLQSSGWVIVGPHQLPTALPDAGVGEPDPWRDLPPHQEPDP
jgi:hypothetical protein